MKGWILSGLIVGLMVLEMVLSVSGWPSPAPAGPAAPGPSSAAASRTAPAR